MLMVMVVVITVAVALDRVSRVRVPVSNLDTVAVTTAVLSNTNPGGTFRTIVPVPISRLAPSLSTGPIRAVYAPLAVSAEMEAEASVETVAAA